MNYLLAKLSGKIQQIWKVTSDERAFYNIPQMNIIHDYEPGNDHLPLNEWHKLNNFTSRGFSCPLIGIAINTTNYSQLDEKDYKKISYIAAYQDNRLIFQRVTASSIIRKPWIKISGSPSLHLNDPIITLGFPSAIYDLNEDTLYFQKLVSIKPIFIGIEELYRTASQPEVNSFVDNDFVELSEGYVASKIGTMNRKRIAIALDKLKSLTDDQKKQIINYTISYCDGKVIFQDGAFQIGSEDDLKHLLFGIEERFYTTIATNEKRQATAVKTI